MGSRKRASKDQPPAKAARSRNRSANRKQHYRWIGELVDQPEYGKNTSYLSAFIQITYYAKLINLEQIREQVSGGKLIVSKAELRICRSFVDLIVQKGFSANAAAKELGRLGFKNRSGEKTWRHGTVISIFKRWKGKI